MSERPSDRAQPKQKRRPGEQLTKDNCDDSDNDEPAGDPGTWGKADAATMARRKVIKVRRGAGGDGAATAPAAADQPAATGASNPFAGVSLTPAPAAASNPFAGVSLTAPAAGQQAAADTAGGDQPGAAATAADGADKPADAAPAEAPKAAEDAQQPASTAPAAAASEQPAAQEQQEGSKPEDTDKTAAGTAAEQQAEGKSDGKPAAASTSGGFGGFGGFAGSTGGFGGFSSSTGGFGGFGGAGGFGGLAASAGKDGEGSKSLFGSFQAPPPGSGFSGFGSAGGSKAKDVEEGGAGEGEEGGEENGQQELFGGPEVAPVVQLSEVPKQTGEEDENSVFTAEGKLYEFVDGKDWKERGRGELRLNMNHSTHRARLVMRQKGSQRLLLNANLYPKMTTSKMVGGKGATFAAVNAAPPVPGGEGAAAKDDDGQAGGAASAAAAAAAAASTMKTYAFKAKSADEISAFLAAVDRYKVERPDVAGSGDKQGDGAAAPAAKNPDAW